jgi:lipopolysaccharide transport system permease protein
MKKPTWKHYIHLILIKTHANLKAEASRNYLSYIWWMLEPILQMFVYYFVFHFMLRRGTENYAAFLLSGLIPWLWFNKAVLGSMECIVAAKGIITLVDIPKIIFPTINVCRDTFKAAVATIVLLGLLIITGINPSFCWLALPVLLFVEFLIILTVSYFVSSIIPFIPDLKYLVSTGVSLLFFASGIFFNIDMIPVEHRKLFYINPLANLIKNYRDILLYNQWPDWQSLCYMTIFSLFAICIMILIFRKLDHIYPRIVI